MRENQITYLQLQGHSENASNKHLILCSCSPLARRSFSEEKEALHQRRKRRSNLFERRTTDWCGHSSTATLAAVIVRRTFFLACHTVNAVTDVAEASVGSGIRRAMPYTDAVGGGPLEEETVNSLFKVCHTVNAYSTRVKA